MRIKIPPDDASVLEMNDWIAELRADGRAEPARDGGHGRPVPGATAVTPRTDRPTASAAKTARQRRAHRAGRHRRPATETDRVVRDGFVHLAPRRSSSARRGRHPRPGDLRRLASGRPRPAGLPQLPAERPRLLGLAPSRAVGPERGHHAGLPDGCRHAQRCCGRRCGERLHDQATPGLPSAECRQGPAC